MRSTVAIRFGCWFLASDKSFMVEFSFDVFLELVFPDTGRAVGGRHEDAVRCDQDRALVAIGKAKTLGLQFGVECPRACGEGGLQPGAVEAGRCPFGPFARRVGETLDPRFPALGTGGLDLLAIVGLVVPGEVFETREVLAAVQDSKRHGVHLGNGDVKMGSAFLDVPDDKARTICANPKFRIDRPNECA